MRWTSPCRKGRYPFSAGRNKGSVPFLRHALLLAACILTIALGPPGFATPAIEEAAALVSRLQAGLLRVDRDAAGRTLRERQSAFAPLIADTHDLDYMARLVLGRAWEPLTPAQQQQFTALFRQLSVSDYARRFRDTAGSQFRVLESRESGSGRVQVDTTLTAPGEAPVSLQYVLHQTPASWRIINILAQGVSDLALQRSQYQQILKDRGFDSLIMHLEAKIREPSAD